jgi:hypothetical protein
MRRTLSEISIDINNKRTMGRGKANWIHWGFSSDAKKEQCECQPLKLLSVAGLWSCDNQGAGFVLAPRKSASAHWLWVRFGKDHRLAC